MDKEKLLNKFFILNSELFDIWHDLTIMNNGDKQFDYVTNPKLADEADRLMELAKKINKIVYQEK